MKKSTKTTKLILSLVTIALIGLSGCKKNDATPGTNQLILGKWKVISSSDKEYQNNVLIRSSEYTPDPGIYKYITYRSNGTCKIESNVPNESPIIEGTYTISNNVITFFDLIEQESDPWTIYEISDSQMVWGYDVNGGNYKVVSRTIFNKVK